MTRFIVVGMGVQGRKRHNVIGASPCITVDPIADFVDYRSLFEVPTDSYDVALLCTPDDAKFELVEFLVSQSKHVLIEKPFSLLDEQYDALDALQETSGSTIYVAYNHRFEPHIATAKRILTEGSLGDVHTVSLSYGNGTAELVRLSEWRDSGLGVIPDLGSHLLDMVDFWWGLGDRTINFVDARAIENRAYDYAMFRVSGRPSIWVETTILSWRNDFKCDIRASEGSLHIASLCKWGPTSITVRKRVHPSGRPDEWVNTLVQDDPTWRSEHDYFLKQIMTGSRGNLETSRTIARILRDVTSRLGAEL